MADALTIAVHMMQNDTHQMTSISQNMVNATTPGYRREVPVARPFAELMQVAGDLTGYKATIPITLPSAESVVDDADGPLQFTGKPFDLALVGQGYFELMTKHGLGYTRAGNFHLDPSGRLVNEAGFPVHGLNGDIVLRNSNVSIDSSGRISQDGLVVAQIKTVKFAQADALSKREDGMLQPKDHAALGTESNTELRVGYLEASNVTTMREMVSMMEMARHFEAAQKLFQNYDAELGTAIQKLGEF